MCLFFRFHLDQIFSLLSGTYFGNWADVLFQCCCFLFFTFIINIFLSFLISLIIPSDNLLLQYISKCFSSSFIFLQGIWFTNLLFCRCVLFGKLYRFCLFCLTFDAALQQCFFCLFLELFFRLKALRMVFIFIHKLKNSPFF